MQCYKSKQGNVDSIVAMQVALDNAVRRGFSKEVTLGLRAWEGRVQVPMCKAKEELSGQEKQGQSPG